MTSHDHEYDEHLMTQLSDQNLMPLICKASSHMTKMNKIRVDLKREMPELEDQQISRILSIILNKLVSSGLKGTIRGNTFNDMIYAKVVECVQELKINVEVQREIKLFMDEKVDWSIKANDHYLAGFNQIDLWGGGAQKNRYNKYTDPNHHSKCKEHNITLVYVVAKKYNPPKRITRAAEKMIESFNSDIIIYSGGLKRIINNWFTQLISS